MHEKTLLYSALGVTTIAALLAVYHAKKDPPPRMEIAPVAIVDAKRLASAEIPVRLTASDGTGLKLVALRAQAAVEDPLALTELHLTFENPEDRVLEGTFRITLPQGASLSRFAMKVGNTWQEGEVVEKQAARRAYEDFLHRKQDPALMEQGAGNEFSARVFPIPARGTKELIVTYAEAIELGASYVLPLRGLPQLGSLDVDVHVQGRAAAAATGKTDSTFGIHQQRFTPAQDFVVESKQIPRSAGLRSGDLAIARVVPFASSRPEPVGSAILLVDTSASRGLGLADQVRGIREMIAKLPPETHVVVAAFDQEVVPIFEGQARLFGEKEGETIVARGALGASDFEGALAWATTTARQAKSTRVIFWTDGVATAGETDGQKMKDHVEALRAAGVTRLDAIAMGGIRDDGFLRSLTRGVLDRDGVVLDAGLGADALARRLGEATSSGVSVRVEGAKWSYPEKLDGLQAGDEVLIYAELEGTRPLTISVGGQPFAPDLRTVDRPLVERAWAQAKIQSLLESPKAGPEATKQHIISLSTRHRVLSPYTSLLVLETDWDYRRFNIDRTANVDILSVRDGHVSIVQNGRLQDDMALAKEESKTKGATRTESQSAPTATATAVPPSVFGRGPAGAVAADPMASAAPAMPSPPPTSATREGGFGGERGSGGDGAGDLRIRRPGGRADLDNADPWADSAHGVAPEPTPVPTTVPEDERRAEAPPRVAPRPHLARPAPTTSPLASSVRPVERRTGATVRPSTLSIGGGIAAEEVQRVVRANVARLRACYGEELAHQPSTSGSMSIRFAVDKTGAVTTADVQGPGSSSFKSCVSSVAMHWQFPAPGSSTASFTQSYDLVGGDAPVSDTVANVPPAFPYEGRLKTVMDAIGHGDKDFAATEANRWHSEQPGDVLSLIALGEASEAKGDLSTAARAYGSILELFSFRADSRRFAGERLERLRDARALALAVDTYGKAVEQRPDHPASHRLHAFALVKKGDYEKAFEAIKKGASRTYPPGRFRGVDRILKEDMGLVAAAWMRAEPARAGEIRSKLLAAGGHEENGPSLRFVLNWETDANDVDFHIHDGKGGHAYYSQMQLESGGELYADVTTGYGPECFTIRGTKRAYPYTLQAHYFSRGPMGYGMGKLEIIEHDGHGKLSFDERPFIVMADRAFVDMGKVEKATPLVAAMK
jgi:tetratricopeptide (TPR) repeat protein